MKTYLSVGIIAASLAVTNLAAAHGGGGGGHFGGGGFGGGGHFSGGGMHFSAPAAHFSAPVAAGRPTFFGGHGFVSGDHHHFGHRPAFFSEFWPSSEYYYGDSDYADDSTPDDTGSDSTVVAVQKALARGGYYHGPIDGTLDLITQDAIARYDRDHRLPVSHTISQQLLGSLRLG